MNTDSVPISITPRREIRPPCHSTSASAQEAEKEIIARNSAR